MPASETTIVRFLAYLSYKPGRSGRGLAPGTLRSYLSAVRSLHLMSGYEVPVTNSPRIALLLKSVTMKSSPPVQKQPIDYELLCQMSNLLPQTYMGVLIKAMWSLAFFACLRGAELCFVAGPRSIILQAPPKLSAVSFGNFNNAPYMVYSVPVSKTSVHGFSRFLGCSSTSVCPICNMWDYLQARRSVGPSHSDSPLFIWADGTTVDKSQFNKCIKHYVQLLGKDPKNYSTHSLRAGSVSQGSRSLPQWVLKAMGGWRSSAVLGYVRNTATQQLGVAAQLTK